MVERSLDKKIRVLRRILETSPDERMGVKGEPHEIRTTDTYRVGVKRDPLVAILNELHLVVVGSHNIPLYDEDGETVDGKWTDDYLLSIIVEKKDVDRLSILLEQYEKQLPKRKKPIIREKTLELIARKLGNLHTGTDLIKFLKNCGVDEELIVYPNTKWLMVFDAMTYLSYSNEKGDTEALYRIIGEATHPLTNKGDVSFAETLRNEFCSYLSYDNFGIVYDEKEGVYLALPNANKDEANCFLFIEQVEFEERQKKQLEFFSQPENREKISLLRKTFQSLMNVIEVFCDNPSNPTSELNNIYQFLNKLTWEIINELGLGGVEKAPRNKNYIPLPFSNLFAAEKQYQEQKRELSWQKIRPEMNAMYGDIEELYQEINGSDILIDSDKQERLNKIQLSLSVLKKKREIAKKVVLERHNKIQSVSPIQKIEIVKGKLEVDGLRDGLKAIAQSKKEADKPKFPHKLPAGTKWEEIAIKFESEEDVYIQVKQFKHTASYKELGLVGRGKNPNPSELWAFLKVLAKVNGELAIQDAEARDKYKKQKELLAKALKNYFSLDYDPFYPYRSSSEKRGNSYKIKITLIPLQNSDKKTTAAEEDDDLGVKEYLKEQAPQVNEE